MKYRKLGKTAIDVSTICMGTMTYGQQNSEQEAFEQLDYAWDHGVNFLDTAEMYSIPPTEATYGLSEKMVGNWMQARKNRDKVIVATKVLGRTQGFPYARPDVGKEVRLNKAHIIRACDESLKRLQTDYIDLYQLHWPDRTVNIFGRRGFPAIREQDAVPVRETLDALQTLVEAGKIRHIGLSNETPWGFMTFLNLAAQHGLPRVEAVQNIYHLVNRHYEVGMSEISLREEAGLLAYSPLASGTLTGKYLGGALPEGSRLKLWGPRFDRHSGEIAQPAIHKYVDLAHQHGIEPAHLAIAFTLQQDFLTSSIIGATKMPQLKTNIAAVDVTLRDDLLKAIEAIHEQHPNTCI
ncbi:MAG: aldo/keto reductase [Alphaproteobacteria bacterium]|nr:aldo/keto reductase [Alphaproteobacteria bacterium]